MKKILLVLVAVLCLSFGAAGGKQQTSSQVPEKPKDSEGGYGDNKGTEVKIVVKTAETSKHNDVRAN